MKNIVQLFGLVLVVLSSACVTQRTEYSPDGPPTVGMPAVLSDRERLFMPDVDAALRNQGLVPVRSGGGDLQLEFEMAEGPVRTITKVQLNEGQVVLARGDGRAMGAPMVGRAGVAENSFNRAFEKFQEDLRTVSGRRGWSGGRSISPDRGDYVY